jgi:pimeloyl-ACP methyl ester carboxylesterase
MTTATTSADPLQRWEAAGDPLAVPGTAATRIWRQGTGPTVVCLHGVPTAAYLYRKVLPALAARDLEGVALDFPGLGFAERPVDFDYSWSGLSAWLEEALDAAEIESFHLVVHDLGGPVGFDLVRRVPGRVQSLTVLNTLAAVSRFTKPLAMRPFSVPGLRRLWVRQLDSPGIYPFFRWKGVLDGPTYEEVRAYGRLLTRSDGGDAFLRIMDGFETTAEFEARIRGPLQDRDFLAQVIWGHRDEELTVAEHGADVVDLLGLETPIQTVEAKHFLQEDVPEEIAERVALLVEGGTDR